MARLTDDGKVISSGKGLTGLHSAWSGLSAWLKFDVPDNRHRMILVRKGNPGGGGQGHGAEWTAGWDLAQHNAGVLLKHAFGVQTGNTIKPRPDSGTHKRHGYDAAKAAIEFAIASIRES